MSGNGDASADRPPLDPDFVRRQLQLQRDGGEGQLEPPGTGDDDGMDVSEERAQEATRHLQSGVEPESPAGESGR